MRLGVKVNGKKLIFLPIKVDSDEKFQRVGGSTIGGATLWGKEKKITVKNIYNRLF